MSELNITPAATVQRNYTVGLSTDSSQATVAASNSTAQTAHSEKAKTAEHRELSREETYAAVEVANKALERMSNNSLLFQVDEATNIVVIKIVDAQTNTVVGQFPNTKMLGFIKAMRELEEQGKAENIGLLFSNRA